MSVNFNVNDFSVNLFALDQENRPTNANQFLEGLNLLASQALDALRKPEDVELAFQQIERVNLIELSSVDKENVEQRIQAVFKNWVKVTFGSYSRHVPRKRLAEQCGPKFQAQYTSQMKEASDRELDLQPGNPSPTDGCPKSCKELFLVYLQTGSLPPGALGENALNMLVLAEQHQMEGLNQACLDFLIENLSHENLDTYLEFTQRTHFPQLKLACLNFMKDNGNSFSKELVTKYKKELSIVQALARREITLNHSSSGKIEAQVKFYTDQTADLLQKINTQFPIKSLVFPMDYLNELFNCLREIAPTLKNLQELIFWKETLKESDLLELKNLFPNLEALGNDAPFLNTFDGVKTYVKNFREPGEEDQESKQPLLLSLNLRAVPNLTDAQLEELAPYLQELYFLTIKSDKITSVVAPKATSVYCDGCTALTTLEVPKATKVFCRDCTNLTTLETPKATSVYCDGCTALTTLEVPKATEIYCSYCEALTTLEAPEANRVKCIYCTNLTTLEVPKATRVECRGCRALTTLETPEANSVSCNSCTNLTTLEVPKATEIECWGCTLLTTLEAPEATEIYCGGCTLLTTLKARKVTEVDCRYCTQLTTLEVPAVTYFKDESIPIRLIKILINTVWTFLAKGYWSLCSLFARLKSYCQDRTRTSKPEKG